MRRRRGNEGTVEHHHDDLQLRPSKPCQGGCTIICRGYAGAVKGLALGTHIKLENNIIEGMMTTVYLTQSMYILMPVYPLCVERLELPSIDGRCFPQPFGEYPRQLRSLLLNPIANRVLSLLLNRPRGRAHTIDAESWRRASGLSITVWVYSSLDIVGSFQAVHLIWGSHRHMARQIDVCNFIVVALLTRKFGRPVKGPVERACGHRVQHSHVVPNSSTQISLVKYLI